MTGVGLMFFNVSEAEEGLYRCVVEFNGDRFTKEFNLSILKKIEFVDCAEDQHPVAGRDQSLVCQVTGDPPPELIWYKNRKPIDPQASGESNLLFSRTCCLVKLLWVQEMRIESDSLETICGSVCNE